MAPWTVWQILLGVLVVTAIDSMLVRRWLYARPHIVKLVDDRAVAAAGMADEPEEWRASSFAFLYAANLASALAVNALIARSPALQSLFLGMHPLERAGTYIVMFWALVLVVSLLIEWPFFSKSIKDKPLSREGLFVCTACNLASYAAGLVLMAVTGMTSLLTHASIQPAGAIAASPYAYVYYLDGDRIRAVATNGYNLGLVASAPKGTDLISVENAPNGDVKLYPIHSGKRGAPIKNFGRRAVTASYQTKDRAEWAFMPRYFDNPEYRRYAVSCGLDAFEGMSVRTPDRLYKLAIDSMPLSWKWSQVTVLPNHQAVAQLGPQIVLVDLESGEIGVLARGASPTAVVNQ
jgi:hypothetical protein